MIKYFSLILVTLTFCLQGCGVKPKQVIHDKETSFPKQYPTATAQEESAVE